MDNAKEMLRELVKSDTMYIQQAIEQTAWAALREINRLEQEVEVLREWGNKDCTSMADERLAELRGEV